MTRLVRVTEELFHVMGDTVTSEVSVEWGEPTEFVTVFRESRSTDGTPIRVATTEPVYEPTITRHFRDDLDDAEVGDGDSWT